MHRTSLWLLILLFFLAGCRARGSFKPDRAEATPGGDLIRRPAVVSFEELDANPQAYQNRLIRVSGAFLQLPSLPCARVHGPLPQWALSDGELRLDGRGFERVFQLVPEGLELTVDGFWRRYRGPVGCGKEPPADVIWYLEAVRLVQPNPLPGFDELATGSPRTTIEPLEPAETPTSTPSPSGTPTASATLEGTPGTVTATPSPTREGTATPTSLFTPTPTATLLPGITPTSTPTPSRTPTATAGGAGTPTGAAPTPTDEPPETPEATATPDEYPAITLTPTPDNDPYP